jgi:hypothetical protein
LRQQVNTGPIAAAATTLKASLRSVSQLWSDYRDNQLDDYVAAARHEVSRFVVSVTRNVSRYREPPSSDPNWLGSIRWARLAHDLRRLARSGPLGASWQILLDVMAADGDFGELELQQELVDAWARYDEATDRLMTFLEEIGHDSLAFLQGRLADRSGGTPRRLASFVPLRRSSPKRTEGSRSTKQPIPVKNDGSVLSMRFQIPAGGEQRLEIGFDIPDDTPRFFVSGEIYDPESVSQADITAWHAGHRRLEEFYADRAEADLGEWDDFGVDIAYPLEDFVGRPDVPAALSDLVCENVGALVDSGIFDGAAVK